MRWTRKKSFDDIDIKRQERSGHAAAVDGLDDAKKTLAKMAHGLTVEGVNEQLEKIKLATRSCGIIEKELVLEAIPRGKNWVIKFELKDRSKRDYLKQSIKGVLPSMPDTTKALMQQFLNQLEAEKKGNSG
jgi:hypothetical protein